MTNEGSPSRQTPMITCGICFGILTEPVTFDCHHSFCARCVKAKLDRGGVGDGFTCPLCNVHHEAVSARTLPEYHDASLADVIARISRGEELRPICQWCEEVPATMYCADCQYTLCEECNRAVHKNAAKRNHSPQALGDGKVVRHATRKCTVKGHEEYRLEFYCLQCQELCCAYCLQIGPHRGHENVLVTKAAQEMRQRMGRDLEELGQVKARIEGMANELNRVQGQYVETYDHVESLVTDRFNAFRHQLVQREVEVRKILQHLRDVGDASLAESRTAFLGKLNSVNEAGITYRRLQHGGADFEVLQNHTAMSTFLNMDVPQVTGTGFRLSDLGDLTLAGLSISLDLHSEGQRSSTVGGASVVNGGGGGLERTASVGPRPQQPTTFHHGTPSLGSVSGPRHAPRLFSFKAHPDVEVTNTPEGIALLCSDRALKKVGIHARETFEALRPAWRELNGRLEWRVRLDLLDQGYIGVVDTETRAKVPQGFHWRPMLPGEYEGTLGRPTHVCNALPACNANDVVAFSYDTAASALNLSINGKDYGTLVTGVHSQVAPCIILPPGEGVTFLE